MNGNVQSLLNRVFDRIYLLNLPRRTDRLSNMERRLKRIGIQNYYGMPGREGAIDFEVLEKFEKYLSISGTRQLPYPPLENRNEMACILSHRDIYRDALNSGCKTILVLEDDILFDEEFDTFIDKLNTLPTWELCYLGASDYEFDKNRELLSLADGYYYGTGIRSTFAIGMKCSILPKLLKMIENPDDCTQPLDHLIMRLQTKENTIVLFPNAIIADVRESDIRPPRDLQEHGKRMHWEVERFIGSL